MTTSRVAAILRDKKLTKEIILEALKSEDNLTDILSHPAVKNRLIKTILDDNEMVTCPITRDVIQHPITASDGRTYEASALLQHFKSSGKAISPFSSQPITAVAYNLTLKNLIDECYPEYFKEEEYCKITTLTELEQWTGFARLERPAAPAADTKKYFSPVKSAYFATLTYAIVFVGLEHLCDKGGYINPETNEFFRENTRAQNMNAAVMPSILIGLLDYGFRVATSHTDGLVSSGYNAACAFFKKVGELPQDIENHLNNEIAAAIPFDLG